MDADRVRCILLGKPVNADRLAKSDLLADEEMPEFVHVKTVEDEYDSWNPYEWLYGTVFPFLWEKDRIFKGRFMALVVYPDGTREVLAMIAPPIEEEEPVIIGEQQRLL